MPNSPRLKRWAIVLSEYDFEIIYTKGTLHKDIDCLSRAPLAEETDNYVEDNFFYLTAPTSKNDWIATYTDEESKDIIRKAKRKEEGFKLVDEIIYKGDKLFIPKAKRNEILNEWHADPTAAHPGVQATTFNMSSLWWPTILDDIKEFVKSCTTCQMRKVERAKPTGSMQHFDVTEPFSMIAVDCLGPVRESLKGNKHLMVAIDCFTRFAEAKPIDSICAQSFVDFLCEFCGRYGTPKTILTDNASTFRNTYVKELTEVFGIEHVTSTPHHSRGNAMVERALQTIQEKLAVITNDKENLPNWDIMVPVAILSYNTTYHSAIGHTPYELVFGRTYPHHGYLTQNEITPQDLHAKVIQQQLREFHADAIATQDKAQAKSRPYFEKEHRPREFAVGDMVLTKRVGRARTKFENKFVGPYEIIDRKNDTYQLRNNETQQVIKRHTAHLKPFIQREREQPQANINLIWAFSIITCLSLLTPSTAVFVRAPPIVWSPSTTLVDTGMMNYKVEIHMTNPCPKLSEIREADTDEAVQICSEFYNELIIKRLEAIGELDRHIIIRKKRQSFDIGIGFVAGIFVTNFLRSITDRIWPNANEMELQRRSRAVEAKLERMNDLLSVQQLQAEALHEGLDEARKAIARTNHNLTVLAHTAPIVSIVSGYITSKMTMYSHLLTELELRGPGGRISEMVLAEITDPKLFHEIDPNTIVLRKLARPVDNVLRVEILARRTDYRAKIFNIMAFKIYDNLTETPKLIKYTGLPRVLVNITNGCVKGLSNSIDEYTTESCRVANYSDSRLSTWEEIPNGKDDVLETQVRPAWPETLVYCYKRNITIYRETIRCPPYAFRINTARIWNTSDYNYLGAAEYSIVYDQALNFDINPIHFKNITGLISETTIIDKFQDLRKAYEKAKKENLAIKIPAIKQEVTFWHTTLMLGFMVITLICILGCILAPQGGQPQTNSEPYERHPNAHRFLK